MQYLIAFMTLLLSAPALAETYAVSFAKLTLRQGERIMRISLKVDGGAVKAITAIPPDWGVELTPGAITQLEMGAVHGVGFLDDMADFNRFLTVWPYVAGEPLTVKGQVATYMTGSEEERLIELNDQQIRLEKVGD